jgi:hypothetical protein
VEIKLAKNVTIRRIGPNKTSISVDCTIFDDNFSVSGIVELQSNDNFKIDNFSIKELKEEIINQYKNKVLEKLNN